MFCAGLTKSVEKTPFLFDQHNSEDKIVIFLKLGKSGCSKIEKKM